MFEEILNVEQLDEVEEGIFSCLDKAERISSYDDKVTAYDRVIGNRFYNRLVWGNWPSAYREFCRQALASSAGGVYLDAGCGSLVFTADLYAKADNRLMVLLDRSIGMLAKGRERIRRINGSVSDNFLFIQGDIFSLPFKDHVFDAVASFGVLHIFDEKEALLTELERVKGENGEIFYSCLVGNNAFGRKYLALLKRAGEVATCHSSETLAELVATLPFKHRLTSIGNMAYGRSA